MKKLKEDEWVTWTIIYTTAGIAFLMNLYFIVYAILRDN